MKFLSVCSGIEAASVAWEPLGWQASGFAEIEPFPCAVLAHHYPDVPNHGDMTLLPAKIRAGEVEAPDLLCGGTPCQAFSVAGLRQSLDDARGNLTLTFCEIADAIDSKRKQPCIVFWENVPGVLNTKDNAFGCFLGALAGEDDALVAPGGRWANAGFVDGPQRAVAWRVLDAQYFGVAQRRRRVFVVASARADFDPAAVLFEFEGVRRDTAPSREKRQEATDGIGSSVASGKSTLGTLMANAGTKLWLGNQEALTGDFHILQSIALAENTIGRQPHNGGNGDGFTEGGPMYTLNATGVHGVAQPIAFEPGKLKRLGYGDAEPGLSPTLRADAGDNQLAVAQPIAFQSVDHGADATENLSPTLRRHDPMAVAQPIAFQLAGDRDNPSVSTSDIAFCLPANPMSDRGQAVAQPIPINSMNAMRSPDSDPSTGCGIGDEGEAMFTLTKSNHHAVAQPMAFDGYNQTLATTSQTIRADKSDGDHVGMVMQSMAVRRLTPVECERLQGFPDNYTNIPWRKAAESPDGPRYKALGNSWAVPVVRWIGERIVRSLG